MDEIVFYVALDDKCQTAVVKEELPNNLTSLRGSCKSFIILNKLLHNIFIEYIRVLFPLPC